MKRVFDIFCSCIILLFFLPIGLFITIWVILESKGGAFYKQTRVGLNGNVFKLLKFRSMRKNAENLGQLTIGMKDGRITKSGRFIRKYKLDEFPQFVNVLKGDMSIVGPRPEVQKYVDLYTDSQREILKVNHGITDIASLTYFDENRLLGESENPQETYIKQIMPAKIKLNKAYLENPTLSNDLKIMWQTFLRIVKA